MEKCIALRPSVFSLQGTAELPDHPSLLGSRCKCGYVFFPRQHYGCEMCGATEEEIEDIELNGKGQLRAFTKVHRSHLKNYKAPFYVGTIILDAGCEIRSLIDVADESLLSVGQTVYSTLTAVAHEEGKLVVDLRFTPKCLEPIEGEENNGENS